MYCICNFATTEHGTRLLKHESKAYMCVPRGSPHESAQYTGANGMCMAHIRDGACEEGSRETHGWVTLCCCLQPHLLAEKL